MEEIQKMSSIASTILGIGKYENNAKYKMTKFVITVNVEKGTLLYNCITNQLFFLDFQEMKQIESFSNKKLVKELVENWILVPLQCDEYGLYQMLYSISKQIKKTNAITHFTILPTTDCNARCFYCFEHGIKRFSMDEKTAIDVAKYIMNVSKRKNLSIQWFGGEPLYNLEAINKICAILTQNKLEFYSTMITNGYLFDKEMVRKSKKNWNLKFVQITLDGTKEIYNKYKSYIYKEDKNPFEKVMRNIKILISQKITVYIRINMDENNEENLYSLIDYIQTNIGQSPYLHIYTWLLYENRGAKNCKRTLEERKSAYNKLEKIEEYIYKKGLKIISDVNTSIKTNACIADSENSVVILPDGRLGKCDHCLDDKLIGSIYYDEPSQLAIDYWNEISVDKLCLNCPIMPICLKNKHCPEEVFECNENIQNFRIAQIKRKILKTYSNKIMNG